MYFFAVYFEEHLFQHQYCLKEFSSIIVAFMSSPELN